MTSSAARDGEQRTSVAAFLGGVRAEIRRAGLTVSDLAKDVSRSTDAVRDGVQRRVREWSFYRQILTACVADRSTVERLHDAWRRLDAAKRGTGSRSANVVPISRHVSLARREEPRGVPLTDGELVAGTPAAFIGLLRRVQVRSGLTPAEVAVRAGIPRSTAYRFVDDRKNTALPTKMEQVRAFLVVCGLSEPQVQKVMVLWSELQGGVARGGPAEESVEQADPGRRDPVVETHDVSDADSARQVRAVVASLLASFVRVVLAVAAVLVGTGITAAVVLTASGWPSGQQMWAVVLMALLFTVIAASWCLGADPWNVPEPRDRRPSAHGGLIIEVAVAAPAVIGVDVPGEGPLDGLSITSG